MIQIARPKFPLGQILTTSGASEALNASGQSPFEFISRHASGDWGIVNEEDRAANDQSLIDGTRLLSAYMTSNGTKIWIITEAADDRGHREATTILLPEEY